MSLKVEPSRETTTTRATPIATTARVTTTTTTQPKPAMRRLRLTLDSNWDLFLLLLWPAIAAASLHAVIATAADKHGGLQAATAGFGITVPIGFSMSIILYKKRFIAAALLALAYLGSCIFGGIAAGKYARGHGIAGDFDKAYAGKVQQQTTLELEKYYRARLFPNEEGGDSSYIVSTPDYTLDTSRHAYVDKGCIVPLYFDANAPDHTNFFLKVPITANYCTQEIIDSAWQQLDVVPTVLETCYGFLANTNNRDDDLEAIDQIVADFSLQSYSSREPYMLCACTQGECAGASRVEELRDSAPKFWLHTLVFAGSTFLLGLLLVAREVLHLR